MSRIKKKDFSLPLPFCFIRALRVLDDVGHTGVGGSSLLGLLIQMLISSENTLS